MKGCGKSTVGKLLAEKLGVQFIELDNDLEKRHFQTKKEKLTFREIYLKYGQEYFRQLENTVLIRLLGELADQNYVLACGGGTPLNLKNQKALINLGKVIYLKPDNDALLERIMYHGIPPFFPYQDDPDKSLMELLKIREPVYNKIAEQVLNCGIKTPEEIITDIIKLL